jgi:ParB-like chromosome segregation protein Spo0J
MKRALSMHGQLTALTAFRDSGTAEIVDGFKRLHAARALGWCELRVVVLDISEIDAKVVLAALHDRRGLSELEEGWLVRSLYREDGLTQPVIAQRLGRHKSWVCRRLMLVEALDPAVQADVRLGLIAPRAVVVGPAAWLQRGGLALAKAARAVKATHHKAFQRLGAGAE